jgi:hypothetical protein
MFGTARDHLAMSKSAPQKINSKPLAYWRENFKQSIHLWGYRETIVALILYALGLLIWFGLVPDRLSSPLVAVTGVGIVAWFPVLILIITPRKMWIEAQGKIAALESELDATSPKSEAKRILDRLMKLKNVGDSIILPFDQRGDRALTDSLTVRFQNWQNEVYAFVNSELPSTEAASFNDSEAIGFNPLLEGLDQSDFKQN